MGKCQQTMNRKRKTLNKQKKEDKRAVRLGMGLIDRNKAELAAVSGPARTGKQARKQLKVARRQDRERLQKALKGTPDALGDLDMGATLLIEPRRSET